MLTARLHACLRPMQNMCTNAQTKAHLTFESAFVPSLLSAFKRDVHRECFLRAPQGAQAQRASFCCWIKPLKKPSLHGRQRS